MNDSLSALQVVEKLQANVDDNWYAASVPSSKNMLVNRMAFRSTLKQDKFIDTRAYSLGHKEFTVSRFFPGIKAEG